MRSIPEATVAPWPTFVALVPLASALGATIAIVLLGATRHTLPMWLCGSLLLLLWAPTLCLAAISGALLQTAARAESLRSELQRSRETVSAIQQRLNRHASSLISAQESERRRIARDLHDDFGQRLAFLSIALSTARRTVMHSNLKLSGRLSSLEDYTNALATDLRRLSHELHPGVLEHLGLIEALQARGDEIRSQSGPRLEICVAGDWSDLPADVILCFYRVAQEALQNVVDHAAAASILVALEHREGELLLRIADDGTGFDVGAATGGLGLISMEERVLMCGGRFQIQSTPGQGTVVEARAPLERAQPGGERAPATRRPSRHYSPTMSAADVPPQAVEAGSAM